MVKKELGVVCSLVELVFLCSLLSYSIPMATPNHSVMLIYLFIYLFSAVLGLRCCARAFSSFGKQGLLFVMMRGLLIVVASLVVEHGL